MIFKPYECDIGIKVNSVAYEFQDVMSLNVEDNERNRLTRGSNASNKTGLAYRDGLSEPKRWTMIIRGMTPEQKALFDSCFTGQTRVDAYYVSRIDGSSKMLKSAIISNRPQQLTLDETPESMDVTIEMESFDSSEIHKS